MDASAHYERQSARLLAVDYKPDRASAPLAPAAQQRPGAAIRVGPLRLKQSYQPGGCSECKAWRPTTARRRSPTWESRRLRRFKWALLPLVARESRDFRFLRRGQRLRVCSGRTNRRRRVRLHRRQLLPEASEIRQPDQLPASSSHGPPAQRVCKCGSEIVRRASDTDPSAA